MKKSTVVILVLIIVLLLVVIGVGSVLLLKANNDSSEEIKVLKNEIVGLSKHIENTTSQSANRIENNTNTNTNQQSNSTEENKNTSKIKTYNDIKGTYESQEINMNEGSDSDPYYMHHILILSKEGTFAYYYSDTDCHYVGYYTIDNNKLTLNSVVATGNDPSANLSNEVKEFTLNNDGTIEDKENNVFTRKSETPREDTNIAKTIDSYMSGCGTSGKDGQGPWFSGLSE